MAAWHAGFLAMLPAIRRHLKVEFRHLDPEARAEAVQEGVCNAMTAYVRLHERGEVEKAYPTPLAKYAARQIRDGRKVGGKLNVKDVSSRLLPAAEARRARTPRQVGQGRRLAGGYRGGQERDARRCRARPPRLRRLAQDPPRRDRKVALDLARGNRTGDVARKYELSDGRISQLRKELRLSWEIMMLC